MELDIQPQELQEILIYFGEDKFPSLGEEPSFVDSWKDVRRLNPIATRQDAQLCYRRRAELYCHRQKIATKLRNLGKSRDEISARLGEIILSSTPLSEEYSKYLINLRAVVQEEAERKREELTEEEIEERVMKKDVVGLVACFDVESFDVEEGDSVCL